MFGGRQGSSWAQRVAGPVRASNASERIPASPNFEFPTRQPLLVCSGSEVSCACAGFAGVLVTEMLGGDGPWLDRAARFLLTGN